MTVERDGEPLDVGGPQARAVLAMLVLRSGRGVSLAELSGVLWDDRPPPSFRAQIHNLISGLRRALPPDLIVTRPPGYHLAAGPGQVDLVEFRGEAAAGRGQLAAGRYTPAAELFRAALALWRGLPCADLPYPAIQAATIGLEEQHVAVLQDRIDADLGLGRGAGLVGELVALTRDHPLDERFRGQLMTALVQAGRVADALAGYRECRRRMIEEVGVEPSARLQDLHQAVLAGTVVPLAGADAAGRAACVVPWQAPPPVPDLVGRADVTRRIFDLVLDAGADVALTGPGGIGKTALMLRVADALRDRFPDGQLYAKLSGTDRTPVPTATVLARFLRALGVPPDEVPPDPEDRAGVFRSMLAARRVLIVLDDVADEAQLRPLLPARGGCRLLATSRRRLDAMEALRTVRLDALPLGPSVDLLRAIAGPSRIDAEPSAATDIARYCGGLPLALRIAGARLAARGGWKVRDMVRCLADARQRLDWLHLGDLDVRASVLGGYGALPREQQRLFRLLAVLDAHEFPVWLTAALTGTQSGAERAVEGLAEAHLVEPAGSGVTGPRYRMHDLVRLLAAELAADFDGPAELRAARHRTFDGWLALAAAADSRLPHWVGADPEPRPRWRPPGELLDAVRADPMGWLDEERTALLDTVRRAADDACARVAWPLAQRLCAYLDLRGLYGEWSQALTSGLRAAEAAGDARGRATMLGLLCLAAASGDDYTGSLAYGERVLAAYAELRGAPGAEPEEPAGADDPNLDHPDVVAHRRRLALARRDGDALAVAFAGARLIHAMRAAWIQGDYLSLFEEVRDGFREGGIPLLEAWALQYVGLVYCRQGRQDEAAQCLARARALVAEAGDAAEMSNTGGDLAAFAVAHGRFDEAAEMAREGLAQAGRANDQWSTGKVLMTLGEIAWARGDHRAAELAYLDALTVWRRLNVPERIGRVRHVLRERFGTRAEEPVGS